jgi:hypothetical protein
METKKFDCVMMKRKSAEKIYTKISKMNMNEELRFWNVSAGKSMVHQKSY